MTPRQLARAPEGFKCCGKCQKDKPLVDFDNDATKPDGKKNWCKPCRAERRLQTAIDQSTHAMQLLDAAILANVSSAKPGGAALPHQAELYQNIVAILGGPQGIAMHFGATYLAAKPGSMTRERMLGQVLKMGQAVSDSNKVSMPAELMSDEELAAQVARDEELLRRNEERLRKGSIDGEVREP